MAAAKIMMSAKGLHLGVGFSYLQLALPGNCQCSAGVHRRTALAPTTSWLLGIARQLCETLFEMTIREKAIMTGENFRVKEYVTPKLGGMC